MDHWSEIPNESLKKEGVNTIEYDRMTFGFLSEHKEETSWFKLYESQKTCPTCSSTLRIRETMSEGLEIIEIHDPPKYELCCCPHFNPNRARLPDPNFDPPVNVDNLEFDSKKRKRVKKDQKTEDEYQTEEEEEDVFDLVSKPEDENSKTKNRKTWGFSTSCVIPSDSKKRIAESHMDFRTILVDSEMSPKLGRLRILNDRNGDVKVKLLEISKKIGFTTEDSELVIPGRVKQGDSAQDREGSIIVEYSFDDTDQQIVGKPLLGHLKLRIYYEDDSSSRDITVGLGVHPQRTDAQNDGVEDGSGETRESRTEAPAKRNLSDQKRGKESSESKRRRLEEEEEEEEEEEVNRSSYFGQKTGPFRRIDELYRFVLCEKRKSEASLVWKHKVEPEQIYHFLKGLEADPNLFEDDLSHVKFGDLDETKKLSLTGVIGTQDSVVDFFREKVDKDFGELLQQEKTLEEKKLSSLGEIERRKRRENNKFLNPGILTRSRQEERKREIEKLQQEADIVVMKPGIYVWFKDMKLRKGYVFIWSGKDGYFVQQPRRSSINGLFRYIFELCGDCCLVLSKDIVGDIDPGKREGWKAEKLLPQAGIAVNSVEVVKNHFSVEEEGLEIMISNPPQEKGEVRFSKGYQSFGCYQEIFVPPRTVRSEKTIYASAGNIMKKFKDENINATEFPFQKFVELSEMFPVRSNIRKLGVESRRERKRINEEINKLRKQEGRLSDEEYKVKLERVLKSVILGDVSVFKIFDRNLDELLKKKNKLFSKLRCSVCGKRVGKSLFHCWNDKALHRGIHGACAECVNKLITGDHKSCPLCRRFGESGGFKLKRINRRTLKICDVGSASKRDLSDFKDTERQIREKCALLEKKFKIVYREIFVYFEKMYDENMWRERKEDLRKKLAIAETCKHFMQKEQIWDPAISEGIEEFKRQLNIFVIKKKMEFKDLFSTFYDSRKEERKLFDFCKKRSAESVLLSRYS